MKITKKQKVYNPICHCDECGAALDKEEIAYEDKSKKEYGLIDSYCQNCAILLGLLIEEEKGESK